MFEITTDITIFQKTGANSITQKFFIGIII